jgi:hypothetical protein
MVAMDARPNDTLAAATLPSIPVVDVEGEPGPPLALMRAAPDRLGELIAHAEAHYGPRTIALGERISRRWLARNVTPYADEIEAVAATVGRPGGAFLNASFEWACSCGVAADPEAGGMRLMRVLDWPLDGLGRGLVAALQRGPAGPWTNLTWPGYAGCVTGLAEGRFAAAVNQAPMTRHGMGRYGDWAANRLCVWRSAEIPPMHLMRQVFEHCSRYEDARHALTHTPIAIPAIFVLAGVKPGDGCIIERTATAARVHPAPETVTNHWLSPDLHGRERGRRSRERRAAMARVFAGPAEGLEWLAEPMLNRKTRLACTMNAATGALVAQGFEAGAAATETLRLGG